MATPQADGKYGFVGAPRRFSTTSTPLRRCRRVREELDFLRRWDGDGAAHGAATMLCRDEMRGDQRVILLAQPAQQVVERLFGREAIRHAGLKSHASLLLQPVKLRRSRRYVHK